jgi:plastocyanin
MELKMKGGKMDKRFLLVIAMFAVAATFITIGVTNLEFSGNTVAEVEGSGEVKEFYMESFTEIIDGNYFPQYSLKEIRVNEGDTVRIAINTTSGTHDFNLDEFGVSENTPTGEVTIVEFVAGEAGSFEYYCSLPNHRANGHWGTLIVE